jgi:hypothetical protein
MTASQEQMIAEMRAGRERLGGPYGVPPRKDDGHELVRKDETHQDKAEAMINVDQEQTRA